MSIGARFDSEADRCAASDDGIEIRLAAEQLLHQRTDNRKVDQLVDLGVEVFSTFTGVGLSDAAEQTSNIHGVKADVTTREAVPQLVTTAPVVLETRSKRLVLRGDKIEVDLHRSTDTGSTGCDDVTFCSVGADDGCCECRDGTGG